MGTYKALITKDGGISKSEITTPDYLDVGFGITTKSGSLLDLYLNPDGDIVIVPTGKALQVNGPMDVTGDVSLGGPGKTLSINCSLATDIIGTASFNLNLGSSEKPLNEVHAGYFIARADSTDTNKATLIYTSLTSTGIFSIISGGELNLTTGSGYTIINGNDGVRLRTSAVDSLVLSLSDIVVQAGKTLLTTSSGNINLPNNASARFKIEGTSVGATVTAAALGAITNGSNADSYHTHVGGKFTATSGEILLQSACVAIRTSEAYNADRSSGDNRVNAIGFVIAGVASATTATIINSGEITILDIQWDSVPINTDAGKIVYLSTSGKVTITAPSTGGDLKLKVGIVSFSGGAANTTKIIIQIGDISTVP